MRLTTENTADWIATIEPDLAASGYTAEDIIHDHAWRCQECGDAFTSASDVEEGECEDCAVEFRSQWSLRDRMRGFESAGSWA